MAKSTAKFLDLPAEVRNRIYMFALTSDCPLHATCREEPDPASFEKVKLYQSHQPDSNHSSSLEKTRYGTPEFNQLKYVCRQLYSDTAGLEAQFNSVSFTLDKDKQNNVRSVLKQFATFAKTCGSAKLEWFKHITFRSYYDPEVNAVSDPHLLAVDAFLLDYLHDIIALLKLCKAHPSMKVDLHVPNWTWLDTHNSYGSPRIHRNGPVDIAGLIADCNPHNFLESGAFISKVFRNVDIDFLVSAPNYHAFRAFSEMMLPLRDADRDSLQEFSAVKNLRFRPDPSLPFDEHQFRRLAHRQRISIFPWGFDFNLVEGGLDAQAKHAKEWYLHGI